MNLEIPLKDSFGVNRFIKRSMAWNLEAKPGATNMYDVGNKAKWRISKRVFQENKARQIFRKTNISYPLICTRAHVRVRIRG